MIKKLSSLLVALLVALTPATALALTPEEFRSLARTSGLIFYDPNENNYNCSPTGLSLVGNDNREKIGNYLLSSGYNINVVAAIIGNFAGESASFNPGELENQHNEGDATGCYRIYDFNTNKKTYTGGFGIAQWTTAGRVKNLQAFADKNGACVTELAIQLRFLVEEELPAYGIDPHNAANLSLEELTFIIYDEFEAPGSSFWTTHEGEYYNDYNPKTYSGSSPLSETETPAAYKSWLHRFTQAQAFLQSAGVPIGAIAGSANTNCLGGGANIASTAINLAWPDPDGTCTDNGFPIEWDPNKSRCYDDIKPAYLSALTTSLGRDPSLHDAQDCGKFVAAVMRGTGIDSEYPPVGTRNQLAYLTNNPKYTEIPNNNNTDNLLPGDILVAGTSLGGHTIIYVGPQANGYNDASASLDERTSNLGHVHFFSSSAGTSYSIFRLVANNGNAIGTETALPIGNPEDNSVNIGCDPRTVDLGVHDGWDRGVRTDYRLCSIPNLPSTTTAGYQAVLEKAGQTGLSGRAVLNSRVAGAVYSMVEAAKADGYTLTAGSTFRSFDWQLGACALSQSEKDSLLTQRAQGKVERLCHRPSDEVAAAGYSNHQSGTAIDFDTGSGSGNRIYTWLKANASRFGFSQLPSEYWHYDTRGFSPPEGAI